jgi:hypothetical protein
MNYRRCRTPFLIVGISGTFETWEPIKILGNDYRNNDRIASELTYLPHFG